VIDITNTPACRSCRWWDGWPGDDAGFCRRHAPKPLPLIIVQDEAGDDHAEAIWPITTHDDWCGEYQRDGGNGS
jgi:hypothetical protein